ncbi:MAG: serine/threonine protein kinase [Candidatus Obscuribacterales bacterium]|nr:serine/threonine protein kinase [Candidatus Obscuribacterales bacterium]
MNDESKNAQFAEPDKLLENEQNQLLKEADSGMETQLQFQANGKNDIDVKERIARFKQEHELKVPEASKTEETLSISKEDAPKLPSMFKGLLFTFAAYGMLLSSTMAYAESAPTLAGLMQHIPMQLFWTSCLYQLLQMSKVLGAKNCSSIAIFLISAATFLLSPILPPTPFIARFADPFLILWFSTQFLAPYYIGSKVDELAQDKKHKYKIRFCIAPFLFLLAAILSPALTVSPLLFNGAWFLANFAFIFFANDALQSRFAQDFELSNQSLNEKVFIETERIQLKYRSFPGIERWLAERFSNQGKKTGITQFIMWVLAPVLIIDGVVVAQNLLRWRAAAPLSDAVTQAAAPALTSAGGNAQLYMLSFFSLLLFLVFGSISYWKRKPNTLILSSRGIQFGWTNKKGLFKTSALTAWENITYISHFRPASKTTSADDKIIFKSQKGQDLAIKLDALDSFEDKEWILRAIKTWGASINRDAEVLRLLEPPADYSYTELWLQALSAAPERERLKPLVSGVKLKQGKYTVRHSMGVGGQGQAYLATETISGDEYVLKEFILPVYVDINVRKMALEQFENEARILRRLDHPQIVKLHDYFVEDHRAYLVLEHIDGASLRKLVESQGPLPETQVRALCKQMCDILSYLHGLSPPVVHRDFTPDNLILNTNGTLKLIDFNVAQQQEESSSGTVVGKHAYLPPEQFRGEPSSQSDIYAAGATVYFLLTGNDPEPISVSHPRKHNETISKEIDAAVAGATELSLEKRFSKIEELNDALQSKS